MYMDPHFLNGSQDGRGRGVPGRGRGGPPGAGGPRYELEAIEIDSWQKRVPVQDMTERMLNIVLTVFPGDGECPAADPEERCVELLHEEDQSEALLEVVRLVGVVCLLRQLEEAQRPVLDLQQQVLQECSPPQPCPINRSLQGHRPSLTPTRNMYVTWFYLFILIVAFSRVGVKCVKPFFPPNFFFATVII